MNTRKTTRRALLGSFALFALASAATIPQAQAATPAEAFVVQVGNNVIKAAQTGSVESFRAVLKASADVDTIAIFSLGSYRKSLTPANKAEYVGLVEDYISRVFSENAQRLAGQSFETTGSQDAADSVIVKSVLKYSDGRTTPVVWRLTKRGGGYKIFDVNVEGIWLATTQKTNFVSVLKQNNGDIGALLAYLKK
jgi:phospholipid transport system substrate-binding protein